MPNPYQQRHPLCFVCRQPVRPSDLGWSQVTATGDQHHYHHGCHAVKRGWRRD